VNFQTSRPTHTSTAPREEIFKPVGTCHALRHRRNSCHAYFNGKRGTRLKDRQEMRVANPWKIAESAYYRAETALDEMNDPNDPNNSL
jgi:hypothetical protein